MRAEGRGEEPVARWREFLASADSRVFWYLHQGLARRWLDHFMAGITHLGGVWPNSGLCLALVTFPIGSRRLGLAALLALAGSHLVVQLLKRQVERPRPYLVLADSRVIAAPLTDYSFPSGHATASFAMATVLSMAWPRWSVLLMALAALVGVSRTYLGHHYPSDVLAGAVIGVLVAYLAALALLA